MEWMDIYKKKLISAEEAVSFVKSGDRIMPGHAAAESEMFMTALFKRVNELENIEIWQGVNFSCIPYDDQRYMGTFKVNSTFASKASRPGIWNNTFNFSPLFFNEYPKAIREGYVHIDVFFTILSPPDENGYCSFGTSVDHSIECSKSSSLMIAEINPNMPRTCGKTSIHVSDVDYFVENDKPLNELYWPDNNNKAIDLIGKNIANLIRDGDTLQLGTGNIPNAILKYLHNKKDLGIHTEVFSDNLIELIEQGVITGNRKSINKGKIIATFIQGTSELYKYVNNNQMIHMMPVDYTNNPGIISQNDNMVAINSAIEVDLTGQVAAESIGKKQFSGVGGQVDFIRGAAASKGGRPIIALTSTTKNDQISKISAVLKQGTPITTSRNDVHYIVTEYGAVNLFGKKLNERSELLISIAHPKFRESLRKEFYEFYYDK